LERLELIAGITGTISSEGRARGGNVAPLPDNPSPTHNVVDETRRDSHLDLEYLAPALAVYLSVFVPYA
jgi:hypothetical protein